LFCVSVPAVSKSLPSLYDSFRNKGCPIHSNDKRFNSSVSRIQQLSSEAKMKSRETSARKTDATVTIRVSGKLFEGHLSYLDQLVESAGDCRLWPVLSLAHLEEVDKAAIRFLARGENRAFSIVSCPDFVRGWIEREEGQAAA
jgi:hypothetical protein